MKQCKIIGLLGVAMLFTNACSSDSEKLAQMEDELREERMKNLELQESKSNDNNEDSQKQHGDYQNEISSIKIPGKFPEATERKLYETDLNNLSRRDLKIMRNEIFARYGYIFRTPDMAQYFKEQSWYVPRYSNVNDMLTPLEKENIQLIKSYE